uniref:Golgin subfamily A member 7/ERF4 domain-containing protein n=1 Tax=Globisporangium ultimum (strain ATCC 200006 / CBS 805.95 / DAOM BR144) TaxID=431595 RepID=K3WTZ5_GLOUD
MASSAENASSRRVVVAVLEPTGEVFVNGLASWYDDEFPAAAAALMTPDEFARAMAKINEALLDHWPCMPCSAFAYGCCVCTLGLSFYCATTQVDEAEARARLQIRRINDQANFKATGVEWRLVRTWYTRKSCIEITAPATAAASSNSSSGDAASGNALPSSRAEATESQAPANLEISDRVV